jgi:hypothetical protein
VEVGIEMEVGGRVEVVVKVGPDVLVGMGDCTRERKAYILPAMIAITTRKLQIQMLFPFALF